MTIGDDIAKIGELVTMRNNGDVTESEFQLLKSRILNQEY